jgi:acetyl esterase/lipase
MIRVLMVLVVMSSLTFGQVSTNTPPDPKMASAVVVSVEYLAFPNIIYTRAANYEVKLDLYRPSDTPAPTPVVVVIHGGGWVNGTKEEILPSLLPYMEMGFAVINVEYRLARISPAPAAVEDCLCALHWVGRHAKEHNFDVDRVVVTGASAGGHLALVEGMIPTSAGFENQCANDDDPSGGAGPWPNKRPKVAAVVNWFGIADVLDLIQGPNMRAYAVTWLGTQPNREELARRLSPITYVRPDLPPIITIAGDRDIYVPYSSQAVRLHEALTKAKVKNQLVTIPGKGHGDYSLEENVKAWAAIKSFLAGAGIRPVEIGTKSR